MNRRALSKLHAFVLDLDGVVWMGNRLVPGITELLAYLDQRRHKYVFMTNNSTRTPFQVVLKASRLGLRLRQHQVLTVGRATAHYLRSLNAGNQVYMIGATGLAAELRRGGFALTPHNPDFVVVGLDLKFNYAKLKMACRAVRAGARFVATNPDLVVPGDDGLIPAAGTLVAAIAAGSGVPPVVVGKPSPEMFRQALEMIGSTPEEAAVVGDNPATDIRGGKAAGTTTILLRTGLSDHHGDEDTGGADYVFADPAELLAHLRASSE